MVVVVAGGFSWCPSLSILDSRVHHNGSYFMEMSQNYIGTFSEQKFYFGIGRFLGYGETFFENNIVA